MSTAIEHDPRTRLVREKYFSLRPKPLEHWLWSQGLPQAAERVFWVHWEEGMRGGDWCSQLSLRVVAQRCLIDPSTVTRAYQLLQKLSLIRREDPGRDPANPFQQATAITEVRIPRELLVQLGRAPNRSTSSMQQAVAAATPQTNTAGAPPSAAPAHTQCASPPTDTALPKLKYRDFQRILGRLDAQEKAAYNRAWLERVGCMAFAGDTALSIQEQGYVQAQLTAIARPAAPRTPSHLPCAVTDRPAGPRRLAPLETARLRKRIAEAVTARDAPETFRQVRWAVEEGALRRFEALKAINIALKKIREGAWSRPHRMPLQWQLHGHFGPSGQAARPETCTAA